MRCSGCETDNPASAKFCDNCGSSMTPRCGNCGAENPFSHKFCGQCGTALNATATVAPVSDTRPLPEGERRHLTVLFCDIAGSTEIAGRLDPEEWGEISSAYHRATAAAVEAFGGYVAKYLGDGVVVYFGYPAARDNDVERSVRAAIEILEAIKVLNREFAEEGRPQLSVRIGMHTGSVVVSDGVGGPAEVFGDVPNIASRLQAMAAPNSILISDAMHRLVSGLFVVQDEGERAIRGIPVPMQLFSVLQSTGVRGRLHAAASLTSFIGRTEEIETVWNRWERARDGAGQVVLIVGEAGIGKSRLVREFHQRLNGVRHTWIETGGVPFFENTPFYPVSMAFQHSLLWRDDADPPKRLAVLERSLEVAGITPPEAVPLVARLLNLPLPAGKYPQMMLSTDQQRRHLLAILVQWVFATARAQPMVIVIEDLHWIDPSTLELVKILADQNAALPMLFVLSARPEFNASWPMRDHHTHLALDRLSERQVHLMVRQVAAQTALNEDVLEQVARRTAGVPLFVEELTRLVLESGERSVAREIPATLQDSLMARLDRLGSAKEVAQVGAVIGSEFSYELLQAVTSLEDRDLRLALARLQSSELVFAHGSPPSATYQFKHALIQDAAYDSLLRSRRREWHRVIAERLSNTFLQIGEERPELLARHLTEAGDFTAAVASWQQAAELGVARGALVEAVQHYRQSIDALQKQADSASRAQHEMTLQIAMGNILASTNGWAAPETAEAYRRARELGGKAADPAMLWMIVLGLWTAAANSSEWRSAQALAAQLVEAANADGTNRARVWAHFATGYTAEIQGDLAAAWEHIERAVAIHKSRDLDEPPPDPGVIAMGTATWIAFQIGRPDYAAALSREVVSFSESRHVLDRAYAHFSAVILYVYLEDRAKAREHAEVLSKLTENLLLPMYSAMAKVTLGWANEVPDAAAINNIREGLELAVSANNRHGLGWYLGLLAETQIRAGDFTSALKNLESAMEIAADEPLFHPYLLSLRGEALFARAFAKTESPLSATTLANVDSLPDAADLQAADQALREAIDRAHRMGAMMFEIRAATAMARLLNQVGRSNEAYDLLSPIYDSFTEGFDTRALVAARSLLDYLRP
ncbi:MAG: AAA family ATPase [Deltaproteobacteria bacterium]|nr:AAA family ATPase [Deltaproteobacteria bacterium]